jgi:nucleotidyltransferase/DNA polymerase involved in DNA repair
MHGVGGKTEARLNAMGYKTLGDIAASSPVRLFTEFGAYGLEIHRNANGIDDSEVVDYHGIKSIGREKTFDSDTKKWDEISNALRFLSGEVFDELRRKGMAFRTVTVKIRYSDFTEHLKSASLVHGSQDMEGIAKNAVKLFNSSRNGDKSIRKIGVRVSGLIAYKGQKKISSFMVN